MYEDIDVFFLVAGDAGLVRTVLGRDNFDSGASDCSRTAESGSACKTAEAKCSLVWAEEKQLDCALPEEN